MLLQSGIFVGLCTCRIAYALAIMYYGAVSKGVDGAFGLWVTALFAVLDDGWWEERKWIVKSVCLFREMLIYSF